MGLRSWTSEDGMAIHPLLPPAVPPSSVHRWAFPLSFLNESPEGCKEGFRGEPKPIGDLISHEVMSTAVVKESAEPLSESGRLNSQVLTLWHVETRNPARRLLLGPRGSPSPPPFHSLCTMSRWMALTTLSSLIVLDIQQSLTSNYSLLLVYTYCMHPQNRW